ncbi:MAG: alanine--tRNA ligase-related protein, partial [Gammaproteobacteria bacterium]
VPSNEERGYVLRKIMRRAIHQGRRIGIEGAFLTRYADVVRDLMGGQYGELIEQRDAVDMWLAREEEAKRLADLKGRMTYTELSPAAIEEMRQATAPVIEDVKKRAGADLVAQVLAEAAKH